MGTLRWPARHRVRLLLLVCTNCARCVARGEVASGIDAGGRGQSLRRENKLGIYSGQRWPRHWRSQPRRGRCVHTWHLLQAVTPVHDSHPQSPISCDPRSLSPPSPCIVVVTCSASLSRYLWRQKYSGDGRRPRHSGPEEKIKQEVNKIIFAEQFYLRVTSLRILRNIFVVGGTGNNGCQLTEATRHFDRHRRCEQCSTHTLVIVLQTDNLG